MCYSSLMQQRSRRDEYSEATRTALVDAARRNFAENGYAATAIETIAREARVTRGALYHHFADKRALFEAVVRETQADLVRKVGEAAGTQNGGPLQQLDAGLAAFLHASHASDYRRIVLEDAPSVLGWQRWREIDGDYVLGNLTAVLTELIAAGLLRPVPVDLFAHLLMGAFAEAALMVAAADEPEQAAVAARKLLMSFITAAAP